jgi:hypothetical protein
MHDHLKLPRRQRAGKLDLVLFWRNETSAEYRREFADNYVLLELPLGCIVTGGSVRFRGRELAHVTKTIDGSRPA